jgi:hypothetical protein
VQQGHIARSRKKPDTIVRDGKHWASLPIDKGAEKLNYRAISNQSSGMMGLDDVANSRLREEGYVVLKKFIPDEVVNACQKETEKLVDDLANKLFEDGKITDLMKSEPFTTRLLKLFEQIPDEVTTKIKKTSAMESHTPSYTCRSRKYFTRSCTPRGWEK